MTSWGTPASTTRTAAQRILDVRFVRRIGPGSPVQEFEEVTGATFQAGQFVNLLAASGQIQEAATGDEEILGVAMKDASGVAGTKIPVYLALSDVIFNVGADADITQADVGDYHDLVVSGGGVHQLDQGVATDSLFKMLGLPPGFGDSTHENYRRCYIQVASSQVGSIAEAAK